MSWSGKEQLLADFLPRFHDPKRARESIDRYVATARVLDDHRAHEWLERDLTRDQELGTVADPDNYTIGPSRFALNGCYHCHGKGKVRLDVDPSHPDFGKPRTCPACYDRDGDHSSHCDKCATFSANGAAESNQCWQCGRPQSDPAGERCRNPQWHDPNWHDWSMPANGRPGDYAQRLADQWTSR